MKKFLICFIIFYHLNINANNNNSIGIGISNSVFYDIGPSYRQYFNNNFGLVSLLAGQYYKDNARIGISLSGLYVFKEIIFNNEKLPDLGFKFYGLIIISSYFEKINYLNKNNIYVIGFGPGIGFELNITKNIAFSFDFPWVTSYILSKTNEFNNSKMAISASFNFYF